MKEEGKDNNLVDLIAADPAFGLTKEQIEANLKPELLISALYHFLGLELDEYSLLINRDDMYAQADDGSFISLDDLGVELV